MASSSSKLVIFGGTGSCGKGVIQRAVELGTFDEIVAIVRNEQKARTMFGPETLDKVQLLQAPLDDEQAIQETLKNANYVCSAMASFVSPHTQMSTVTSHVINAAKERENKSSDGSTKPKLRYICYGLCGLRKDSTTLLQKAVSFSSPWKFGPAVTDHQAQIKMLEENSSDLLDYSVFGTCTMADKPVGRAYIGGSPEELDNKARLYHSIGILDAAELVLKTLRDDDKELPRILDIIYQ